MAAYRPCFSLVCSIQRICHYQEQPHFFHSQILERNMESIRHVSAMALESMIKLCKGGLLEDTFEVMDQRSILVTAENAYYLVQECNLRKDLESGRRVRCFIGKAGLDSVEVLGNYLIRLFASAKSLFEANEIFETIVHPTGYTWSAIICAHAEQVHLAIELYTKMQQLGTQSNKCIDLALLKAFTIEYGLMEVRLIHSQVLARGFELDSVLGSVLIDVYSKSKSLHEAQKVFCNLPDRNVISWSTMIAGHTQNGDGHLALRYFEEMRDKCVRPDIVLFSILLKACASIGAAEKGRLIHDLILVHEVESNIVLGNGLIDMYAKCGSLKEARFVFDKMPNRNIISWGAIISGYAQNAEGAIALDCFEDMQQNDVRPNETICASILKVCGDMGAVYQGSLIHKYILKHGLEFDIVVGTAVVNMYANCDILYQACKVFDNLEKRNVVSWNAIIMGCAEHGEGFLALDCFEKMKKGGINPDKVTFLGVLKACSSIGASEFGRTIHDQILEHSLASDVVMGSSIVDMYAKCGNMEESFKLFERLPQRNLVSWNAIIAGYVQHDETFLALSSCEKMQEEGFNPDGVTFSCILKACGSIGTLEEGRLLHDRILRFGLHSDIFVGNALIDMYAKCCFMRESLNVFEKLPNRNMASWNTLIAGYAQCDEFQLAISCFESLQEEDIEPDKVTFMNMLKVCASLGAIEWGRLIHDHVLTLGLESDAMVGNTLIDMYAKCQMVKESCKVFEKLLNQDVVSWNAMITGCVDNDQSLLASGYFQKMQNEGIKPDRVTFLGILKACASIGAIQQGRFVHNNISACKLEDTEVGNTLVDMYAKCGSLMESQRVFERLPNRSIVSWGAIISACAQHGSLLALEFFQEMQDEGTKPTKAILLAVLTACNHLKLVDKAVWYFEHMKKHHGITPLVEHHNCMIDLLGHAGFFKEAEDLVRATVQPNISGWTSLLNACRCHGNVKLGRQCFDELLSLDPHYASSYVLTSNMYAEAHIKENVREFLRF